MVAGSWKPTLQSRILSVRRLRASSKLRPTPERRCSAFVLGNGRETQVSRSIARDIADVILTFRFEEIADRWLEIEALLWPPASGDTCLSRPELRPSCSTHIWDDPPARCWRSNPSSSSGKRSGMEQHLSAIANLTNHISRGWCRRGCDGRLQMEFKFRSWNTQIQEWLNSKGLSSIIFETDDQFISTTPDAPALITGVMKTTVVEGEENLDLRPGHL